MNPTKRIDGRACGHVRPISITYNIFEYAQGSVLYEIGKTKVLCAVSLQTGVPQFLRGTKSGWLTAHYTMLPMSTPTRTERESQVGKPNGRFIEISRLIGRCLRASLDLDQLGERTIVIDCDILQADGGTRTACITAASLALKAAQKRWLQNGTILTPLCKEQLIAISVGLVDGVPHLDPDFSEDSGGQADFNFVFTAEGSIVEVQGTSEKAPIAWDSVVAMQQLAAHGAQEIAAQIATQEHDMKPKKKDAPLFSLARRFASQESNTSGQ